ncbi:hypothetical protein [Microbacterium sp. NPDC064584]|uniref:hypothetical protein n=1 Tax=Microbacterium sp. NPDC064584 TaxID=3155817 RepID=UPI003436B7E6
MIGQLAIDTTDMRRFAPGTEVDVVVVGTGAGGAPVLAELAAAGLDVVALEAGPFFDPVLHTPDETDAAEINWMDERLSAGEDPTAFGPNNSGRGVGGSTLHWGAFTPRPDAGQLRLRTRPVRVATGRSHSTSSLPSCSAPKPTSG